MSNRTNETIRAAIEEEARPVAAEVQFDSARRWSALAYRGGDLPGLYVLGAPEVLLPNAGSRADAVRPRVAAWAEQGLRVVLLAHHQDARAVDPEAPEPRLPDGLEPLGLAVLRDELRPAARETIAAFARAGIALKIISGDNPATVSALARAAGVPGAAAAVSGSDLDAADPALLARTAGDTAVFGRVGPALKASIVEALQRQGHHVAMIGDGVNDVPALKRADVAISVRSGSPVTRNIADLLLLDDSFASLPRAFSEGRRIRTGMEAVIRLFLVRTFATVILIVGAAFASSEFPLTPRLTAILSLLTVGIPCFFIAAWAAPRLTPRYLLPAAMAFVVPAALLLGIMGIVVYEAVLGPESVTTARTAVTAAAVFAGLLLIPFADDPPARWMRLRGLATSPGASWLAVCMLALFVVAFAFEPLRRFYELRPLGIGVWLIVVAGTACWAAALAVAWRVIAARAPQLLLDEPEE